jgi:hypothetical protein
MRLPRVALLLLLGLVWQSVDPRAAGAALDPKAAEADVAKAREQGAYTFCKSPSRPLSFRAIALCPLAEEIEGCEGFAKACLEDSAARTARKPKDDDDAPSWFEGLAKVFAALARVLVWVIVAAVALLLAVPVVQAIARARRDRKVKDPEVLPEDAKAEEEKAIEAIARENDAEALLSAADDLARKREYARALSLYLAAALRGLDRRGLVRLARHRTNGEYVRGCRDAEARALLRDIVRDVDRVEYGGEPAGEDAVARAAERARTLVRSVVMATMALALSGFLVSCNVPSGLLPGGSGDPGGDELVLDLLRRQGITVGRVTSSLAHVPMPKPDEPAPAIVVDMEQTALDDEAATHLVEWVDAGGALVLLGRPTSWPKAFGAEVKLGTGNHVSVRSVEGIADEEGDHESDGNGENEGYDDDDDDENSSRASGRSASRPRKESASGLVYKFRVDRAKLAHPAAFAFQEEPIVIAEIEASREVYAALRVHGKGVVLGMASAELMTNASVARKGNAAALVAILSHLERDEVRFARPEDGIAPPSNPIAGLSRAGLGLGLWHALAAAVILFAAVGARLARPRPEPKPSRRAFTENVEATGAYYAYGRLAPHALAAYARFADGRLRARMPKGTDVPSFLASRTGESREECERIWARAQSARSGEEPRGDEIPTLKKLSTLFTVATRTE